MCLFLTRRFILIAHVLLGTTVGAVAAGDAQGGQAHHINSTTNDRHTLQMCQGYESFFRVRTNSSLNKWNFSRSIFTCVLARLFSNEKRVPVRVHG